MADRKPKYKCGDMLQDTITGFEGIATAVTTWLNGCIRYSIQPRELREGKPVEEQWFDEKQVALVKQTKAAAPALSGGPCREPKL